MDKSLSKKINLPKLPQLFKREEIKENNSSWINSLVGSEISTKIWKSVSLCLLIISIVLTISHYLVSTKLVDGIKSQRLILVPAIHKKINVPAEAFLSSSYIKAVSKRVVELQEQWSYDSLEDNYQELFRDYYSHKLMELTKANLLASNRLDYVKEKKIVSTFKLDLKKSKFEWCKKLDSACAVVVGTRRIYINHNEPHTEKEVAYLIIGSGVYPSDSNPFALRISRLKLDDTSESPYENILSQFDAAMKGVEL